MHLSDMLKVAFLSHRKLGPLDSMLKAKFHPQVHYRPAKPMLLSCPRSFVFGCMYSSSTYLII